MTPHKHSAAIKAWADGATIQFRYTDKDTWKYCDIPPKWHADCQYRAKPAKYRVYLSKAGAAIAINEISPEQEKVTETLFHFDRWLSDWVEYVA